MQLKDAIFSRIFTHLWAFYEAVMVVTSSQTVPLLVIAALTFAALVSTFVAPANFNFSENAVSFFPNGSNTLGICRFN